MPAIDPNNLVVGQSYMIHRPNTTFPHMRWVTTQGFINLTNNSARFDAGHGAIVYNMFLPINHPDHIIYYELNAPEVMNDPVAVSVAAGNLIPYQPTPAAYQPPPAPYQPPPAAAAPGQIPILQNAILADTIEVNDTELLTNSISQDELTEGTEVYELSGPLPNSTVNNPIRFTHIFEATGFQAYLVSLNTSHIPPQDPINRVIFGQNMNVLYPNFQLRRGPIHYTNPQQGGYRKTPKKSRSRQRVNRKNKKTKKQVKKSRKTRRSN